MSDEVLNHLKRLKSDFTAYAAFNLKIKDKSGRIMPFVINAAQKRLHERIEAQKARIGKVRMTILKGRQQGISTYTEGRFYWLTSLTHGLNTFILAHKSDASDSIYKMVKNYYDLSVDFLKPQLGATNAKEFIFQLLSSGYRIGSAHNDGLGRGQTIQNLHWSEVAFSPNCDEHVAGLLQCVPDIAGTEIILESTSNGAGDFFYRKVMQGLQQDSDWETVFLPWYLQDEYRRPIEGAFSPTTEEQEFLRLYEHDGLTMRHLNWRRNKLQEFHGDELKFKREYPFNVQEAFEASDDDAVFKVYDLRRAFTTDATVLQESKLYPLIIAVDPAIRGDKIAYVMRRGRIVVEMGYLPPDDPTVTTNRIARMIDEHNPAQVAIDAGSFGIMIIDALRKMGYNRQVHAVNFGGRTFKPDRYYHKREEMYGEAAIMLSNPDEPFHIYCTDIKLKEAFISEASAVRYDRSGYQAQLKLESKVDLKKRIGCSPDLTDAFVMTFAQPVFQPPPENMLRNNKINSISDYSPYSNF